MAASEDDLRAALEQRFKGDRSGACIAAAIIENGTTAQAYYCASAKSDRSLDERTAVEIGSITKTMTAALLAEIIGRGEIAIYDPLAKLLPPGSPATQSRGQGSRRQGAERRGGEAEGGPMSREPAMWQRRSRSPIKRGAMMVRSTFPILFSLVILTNEASAQGVGLDPNSLRPSFRMPLSGNTNADTFKRLPYQDLGSEIHIEIAADELYDFDKGQVRSSAADYFQQAANLIFEEARGQVRIECHSDRDPPAIGQKLAERCASAIVQWMIVEEKLTKVKFTAVGRRVPVGAISPNTNNLLVPKPNSRANVTIDFAKK